MRHYPDNPIVAVGVVGFFLWQKRGAEALDYRSSWGDALQEARDSGRPILINFGGPW